MKQTSLFQNILDFLFLLTLPLASAASILTLVYFIWAIQVEISSELAILTIVQVLFDALETIYFLYDWSSLSGSFNLFIYIFIAMFFFYFSIHQTWVFGVNVGLVGFHHYHLPIFQRINSLLCLYLAYHLLFSLFLDGFLTLYSLFAKPTSN